MAAVQGKRFALPAFRHRNFRLFWVGQGISLIGTQMQMAALGWLIFRITNSTYYLGYIQFMSALPVMMFSMFAGIIADRMSKRKMLLITQTGLLVQAVILAMVAAAGKAAVWNMIALGALMGIFFAFDAPVRQSFVSEMVPPEDLFSAVALNSSLFNASRVLGPALAGILISVKNGEELCFYINAASFLAVIAGVLMMRDSELIIVEKPPRTGMASEMKEGLKHVRSDKRMMGVLLMLSAASIFGMPSFVLMPAFARDILHAGPKGFGMLGAATGVGALTASISMAFVKRARRQGILIFSAEILFSVFVILFSQSTNLYLSMAALAVAAFGLTAAMAMTNTTLQLLSPAHLRGRVVGIFIFVMMGMMPFGSYWAGAVADRIGSPEAVLINGIIIFVFLACVAIRFPGALKIDAVADDAPDSVVATVG